MTKRGIILLSITLFLAATAPAQTSYSDSNTTSLVPMTVNSEVRYKYGLQKQNDGIDRVVIPSGARSTCDLGIESNVEQAWLYGKSQAVFLYSVSPKDLVYETIGGQFTARFSIFVRVRDKDKKIDGGFEDLVTDIASEKELVNGTDRKIVYRKIIDLPPGSYRADVTVRDISHVCRDLSSRAFTLVPFTVPPRGIVIGRDPNSGISPFRSTLVLGRPRELFDKDPAIFHAPYAHWMVPDTTGDFQEGETIAVWYSLSIPIFPYCATGACPTNPDDVEYTVENADGKSAMRFAQDWKEHRVDTTGRVMTTVSTDSLKPGKYRIIATVKQRSSGMTFSQSDVFRIIKRARVSPDK